MVSRCKHNKQKSYCYECKGSQICKHNRQKATCKKCGGSRICKHNRQKQHCYECNMIFNKKTINSFLKDLDIDNSTSDMKRSIEIFKIHNDICIHNNIKKECDECKNNFVNSILV